LFQTAAACLAVVSVEQGWPIGLACAVGLWVAEALFVKMPSLVSAAFIAAWALRSQPVSWPWIAGASVAAALLFVLWIRWNGKRVGALLRGLMGHEVYLSGTGAWRRHVLIRVKKVLLLVAQFGLGPAIPLAAAIGLVSAPHEFLWVWLVAGAVTLLLQSGQVWYYSIPLLPSLAALAALAPAPVPAVAVSSAAAILLIRTFVARNLNRVVWGFYDSQMAERNEVLDRMSGELRSRVGGKSLLVYGCWNQAYVLADASYPTTYVSPTDWLHAMAPGWEPRLNERMIADPPAFILDTEGVLDDPALESRLGLVYRLVLTAEPSFRLFSFVESRAAVEPQARLLRDSMLPVARSLLHTEVSNEEPAVLAGRLVERARAPKEPLQVFGIDAAGLWRAKEPAGKPPVDRLILAADPSVIWISRFLGQWLIGQATVPRLLGAMLDQSQGSGLGHFFLGGTSETQDDLVRRIGKTFPGVTVAGLRPGTVEHLKSEEEAVVRQMGEARPAFLWVLGTFDPGDPWIDRLTRAAGSPVVVVQGGPAKRRRTPPWEDDKGFWGDPRFWAGILRVLFYRFVRPHVSMGPSTRVAGGTAKAESGGPAPLLQDRVAADPEP
jgi:hypothetical protein